MVVGPNGAGKTNLLESVHIGSQGFALRTRRELRLIRFGEEAARISMSGTQPGPRTFTSQVTVDSTGDKRLVLDGAARRGE